MSSIPHRNAIVVALAAAVLLAFVAWVAGSQIRSPAQVAADTAPPAASLITVPVERRRLSTEVIVRGTVRFGEPQTVVLPISNLKPGSSVVSSPPRVGATLNEGSQAMSISGRPLFVLRGAEPMYRDLVPGAVGADVLQLEEGMRRLGFFAGTPDSAFDGSTEAAIGAWYQDEGWTPFETTETLADQLRAAEAAAASAREAVLQARLSRQTAARIATPAEINQARSEIVAADEAVDSARLAVGTARARAATARATATRLEALVADPGVGARSAAEIAAADAEVGAKQAALNAAIDAQAAAQRALDTAPPESTPAELEALRAALRQAIDAVAVARQAHQAALSAADAARAAAQQAAAQASLEAVAARRDAQIADAEIGRARAAVASARRQAALARRRVAVLTERVDTGLMDEIVTAAESSAVEAEAEVARLSALAGVQLPADEVLFFPVLPLRVDSVTRRRGDSASGRLMTVSNSQLAADSSLSLNDAKLVRVGARVTIEEPDLGIKIGGRVSRIADKPGTNKVDPTRVYFEATPVSAPARLVGASVRLRIAVNSTKGAVLAVPLSALSVGAGGESRIQILRKGGTAEYVTVVPGLAANGLVEVRPLRRADLKAGNLVVVGERGTNEPIQTDVAPLEPTPGPTETGAGTATSADPGAATGTDTTTPSTP